MNRSSNQWNNLTVLIPFKRGLISLIIDTIIPLRFIISWRSNSVEKGNLSLDLNPLDLLQNPNQWKTILSLKMKSFQIEKKKSILQKNKIKSVKAVLLSTDQKKNLIIMFLTVKNLENKQVNNTRLKIMTPWMLVISFLLLYKPTKTNW